MKRRATQVWLAFALLMGAGAAPAHLMPAQQGTLNLLGDGAFLVLSVPVSALQGVDDDGDGLLSASELKAHWQAISHQVEQGVQLSDEAGARPLQGLMLHLSPPDDAVQTRADQLVVLGRFALASPQATLRLQTRLFGQRLAERQVRIRLTRGEQAQNFVLTPARPAHRLWSSEADPAPRNQAGWLASVQGLVWLPLAFAPLLLVMLAWHLSARLARGRRRGQTNPKVFMADATNRN